MGKISQIGAAGVPMEQMILALNPSPAQETALEQLIQQQQDPKSPLYHHFLSPQDFAAQFGISDNDVTKVTSWLKTHGFTINEIPAGHRSIVFSGTSENVRSAFNTQIRRYAVNGETHFANESDPQIPAALARVVNGVVKLHDFRHSHSLNDVRSMGSLSSPNPEFTYGSAHFLAPADYGIIYNINPLYSAGIDGTGQSIAIAARSNVSLSDLQTFRSEFGLVANAPTVTIVNSDPGQNDDVVEAILDTEWSGAVAPKARVNLVVAASTNTADGIDLSVQYIVNHNVAPVMSLSYGSCEANMGASELAFYNSLWQQAAAQGMTVFVSSGDSGAAGCDYGNSGSGSRQGINGLCSSPYSVCVGGTEFSEGTNPGQYWLSGNANRTMGSAQSYIPEVVWNEGASNNGSGLWAGGGGASIAYTKPSWQMGPGVPADGRRDVPDVSLDAAGHDGYLIVYGGGLYSVGGTSASSPSFAGLMALVNQKTAATQGNANPNFYALAAKQANGGTAIFHDITGGNNSVPGVTGFNAGQGYDQATGLGSVDASMLVNHWTDTTSTTPTLTLQTSQALVNGQLGQSSQLTLTSSVSGTFNSAVSLSISSPPAGVTATFGASTVAAPGSGSVALTVAVAKTAAYGTYPLTITAQGGSLTSTATITLVLQSTGSFKLNSNTNYFSVGQTNNGTLPVTVTPQGGFSSPIALTMTGLPAGVTGAFAQATIIPTTASASTSLTLTVAKTAATGVYPVNLVATGGGLTQTWPIQLTVTPPAGCTLTANPANLTLVAGKSTNLQITCGNVQGGFSTALNLTVGAPPSGTVAQILTNYVVPGGTGSTIAISSYNTATPGTYSLSVNASEASSGFNQTLAIPFTINAPSVLLVEPSQNPITVQQGSSARMTVAFVHSGTFKSAVTLGVAGGGSGLSAAFSTTTLPSPGDGTPTLTVTASSNAALGSASYFVVYADGGGQTNAAPIGVVVTAAPPNFTLTASSASASLQQGASANVATVAISGFTNGFHSPVALSATGLPAGLTAKFSTTTLSGSGSAAVLSLTAAASATPGVYQIVVAGTSGGVTNTLPLSVAVTGPPNFRLASSAATAALTQGSTGSVANVTISNFVNGFSSPVALSATGLPTGLTAKFSTATLSGSGSAATLSLTAAASATPGAYQIVVTGTGGGVTNTVPLPVTVTAPPNFRLAASAATAALMQGSTGSVANITISNFVNGFNSSVVLSATGLPTGLTAKFSTATLSGSGSAATLSLTAAASATPGAYQVLVTGTGGGVTNTVGLSVTLTAPPNFRLAASAATAALIQGSTGSVANITISNFVNGFNSPVALSATGLPTGLTVKFSTATLSGSGSAATLSLTAAASATPGAYQVVVTGIGGGVTNTVGLSVAVTAPPNFRLAASAATAAVMQGSTGSVGNITISNFVNGFNSPVALSAASLPTGLTAKFSAATLSGSGSAATLSLTAAASATPGAYQIVVTGTGGGVTNTVPLSVAVTAPPNFRLAASVATAALMQGSTGSAANITISNFVNGFNSPVALSATGLPTGLTVKFSTATLSGSGSAATLSLTAAASATPGAYQIVVTGTGGGVTNTVPLFVAVTAPPNFRLAASAATAALMQGSTASVANITISNFVNGFNSPVALSAAGLPVGVTAKFSTATLSGAGSTGSLSLSATGSVGTGIYQAVITGTGGGVTNTVPISVTLTAPPNFKLTSAAGNSPLVQGNSVLLGNVTISNFVNGFNAPVALSASNLPAGITARFSATSLAGSGSTAAVYVTSSGSAPTGAYQILLTGTGANITNTVTIPMTVTGTPSFRLTASVASASIQQATSAAVANVTISGFVNGFNAPVTLSVSGLPAGMTAKFSSTNLSGQGSTAGLSLTTTGSVACGVYQIAVSGTGANITSTAIVSITVNASAAAKH